MKFLPLSFLVLLTCPLAAQNDITANVNLQFRFTNPGARAQAMGGAFIGLADDTTAIFANPAGLVLMRDSTLVLEANQTDRDNRIPFYAGRIDQIGAQDFSFDLEERTFADSNTSVPFAAYVRTTGKIPWGVYYAEEANFSRRFDTGGVGIVPVFNNPDVSENRLGIFSSSNNLVDLSLRSLGFTAAKSFGDRFSAGITISLSQLDYRAQTVVIIDDPRDLFPEFNFPPVLGFEDLIGTPFSTSNLLGEEEALAVYAGLLWLPNDRFRVGLAYNNRPSFDYDLDAVGWDDRFENLIEVTDQGQFNVPDSMGLGLSFLPTETTILSMEVKRVFYSDLSDDFLGIFANPLDTVNATQVAPDVTEIRVGLETFLTNLATPVALRLGYYIEPYHALTNTSDDTQIIFRYFNEDTGSFRQSERGTPFLQRFASDLNHITFGVGFSFSNWTLDFAGDIDDENAVYSISSIYRFN